MDLEISLRPINDSDMSFLAELYGSTRAEEMELTGWPPEQIESFLQMQFHAQHTYYQEHYGNSNFDVIMCGQEPIGRLYLQRNKNEHRIVDIALIPQWRRKGIGAKMLGDILKEAGGQGKAVGIHVEHNNPALNLYKRLGFKKIADTGVYFHMEWNP